MKNYIVKSLFLVTLLSLGACKNETPQQLTEGKTKKEIINLLGKPEFEETNSEFSYYLGYSGRGINTGRLIFHIGLDGKICDFKVHQG